MNNLLNKIVNKVNYGRRLVEQVSDDAIRLVSISISNPIFLNSGLRAHDIIYKKVASNIWLIAVKDLEKKVKAKK